MAVFRLESPETWLPTFARGRSLAATKVRMHHKDGTRSEHTLDAGPNPTVTTNDERAIRHLEADPRFTRIS